MVLQPVEKYMKKQHSAFYQQQQHMMCRLPHLAPKTVMRGAQFTQFIQEPLPIYMLPDVLLRLVYGVPGNVAHELGPATQSPAQFDRTTS